MKKYKEIIFGLLFICMLIGVTSASLTFMGVIGHTENVVNDTEKREMRAMKWRKQRKTGILFLRAFLFW